MGTGGRHLTVFPFLRHGSIGKKRTKNLSITTLS
jgi:hypothetical protein